METTTLKQQLKEQIIQFLNLTHLKPDDIKDDQPLFGEGLGLDSIDSLELIALLDMVLKLTIQKKAVKYWLM
jgi:acyl carrier protein